MNDIKASKTSKTSEEKQKEHFMKVCPHGVPHGFTCQGCDKVIEIPEDAVIKPKPVKEEK